MAREHDRQDDKERQLARFQRQLRHLTTREEEQRRKQAAKAKRAARTPRPRARTWDEDDDAETFAKIVRRAPAKTPRAVALDLPRGTVTAVHAAGIEVDGAPARLATELLLDPARRPVVGDVVAMVATDGPPRAVAVLPRRSWLARLDPGNPHHELVLAANVDVGVIVVAVQDPPLRPGLIDRYLIALARGGVAPLICANKADLLDAAGRDALAAQLAPYAALSLRSVLCSTSTGEGLAALRAQLTGRTAVFLGHSGVGKSSLLNALDPGGNRRIGAVGGPRGHGRHTTTAAALRVLGDDTRVIDTPGIRAFGLDALTPDELRDAFPEFAPFAAACRFADCTHTHEPHCGVRDAAATGQVSAARLASYQRVREAGGGRE
jgi:ribosome biogenesis GTPase